MQVTHLFILDNYAFFQVCASTRWTSEARAHTLKAKTQQLRLRSTYVQAKRVLAKQPGLPIGAETDPHLLLS